MADQIKLRMPNASRGGIVTEAIFNLFVDYLRPGSLVTAEQAAINITRLPSQLEKTLDDGFLFELWDGIFGIAEQISQDHIAQDKVVKVVKELMMLPDTGDAVWGSHLWTGLPVLGAALRERLNRRPQSDESDAENEAWIRFHAFSAKLMGAGVVSSSTHAIWMLREGLEEQNPPKSKALDRGLLTAAMYIEFAGPILVEALAANPDPAISDEKRRMLRGGSLFKGEPGLGLKRWSFWTERFIEEAEKTGSKDAKERALRAARLMIIWTETRLQQK
ncbi:hypothetical protein F5Y05DRAFT_336634 [Hypoxylon sp. FL0543]|nr:hypothetical protein F5Y05DRAFT_336634 [Hypoxylon sp. FL0543]